jgi:hypothetical protein
MPLPCPCCRASNDAGPACRRCKADLSLLFSVASQRDSLVADARRHARAGRFADALRALDSAAGLRAGPDLARLRAAVLLLSRDFPAAVACYSAAGKSADRRGGS